MQHGDGIYAQNSGLDERIQRKRHAGNLFSSSDRLPPSSTTPREACRKEAAGVVQYERRRTRTAARAFTAMQRYQSWIK